jgi:hypothetical protein
LPNFLAQIVDRTLVKVEILMILSLVAALPLSIELSFEIPQA